MLCLPTHESTQFSLLFLEVLNKKMLLPFLLKLKVEGLQMTKNENMMLGFENRGQTWGEKEKPKRNTKKNRKHSQGLHASIQRCEKRVLLLNQVNSCSTKPTS